MNEIDLLTLLLVDSGDYHAIRCARVNNGLSIEHFEQSEQKLIEHDLIEFVGDELTVSAYGREIIEYAVAGMLS
jgi:hypothetical protein